MSYYTLEILPAEDEEGEEVGYFRFVLNDPSVALLRWYDGVRLDPAPTQPIGVHVDDMGGWSAAYPDYSSTPVPLVSGRMRRALDRAGVSNIEWFDVALSPPESSAARLYFAMNIVGSVAAVNGSRSVVQRVLDQPGADIFDHLEIDSARARGLALFRMAESVSTVVVDDHIKQALADAGVDTVAFSPVTAEAL